MTGWNRALAAGAAAVLLAGVLAGCTGRPYRAGVEQRLLQLQGPAVTFSVADQRFAIAAFPPPATMLLVRAGPMYLWATPVPSLHQLYVQDVVGDHWIDSHVVLVGAGTVDCSYAFRWDQ